jgi:hypothetical protein
MSRLRIVGAVIAVTFLVVFWMFTPETFALMEHLRYGSSVSMSPYALHVRWDDTVSINAGSLVIAHAAGRFRRHANAEQDVAIVSYTPLSSGEHDFNYARDHQRLDEVFLRMGERFSSRQVTIAGTHYACWEFEPNENVNIGNKSAWNVDCRPEGDGLRIFFFGSRSLIASFYDGLSQIKRTQG